MGSICSCSENENETIIHEYVRKHVNRCQRCNDRMDNKEYVMFYGHCMVCRLVNTTDSIETGILTDEEDE